MRSGQSHADSGAPASVSWSLTAKPRSRTMLSSSAAGQVAVLVAVELSELPVVQRREQGQCQNDVDSGVQASRNAGACTGVPL